MTLDKGFLQSKLIHKIPTYKYVVGVVIGLLMAFCLYALQYMAREGIRWTSISETDVWLFNEAEVSFYNLIFAFIAIIVGQSFFLEYIFNSSKRNFKIRSWRLQTIINDQRVYNWYFLTWFSKMAMMYGVMFGTSGLGGYYLMSFYPDYRFMFVLMIIVLFLQPWNGLLLTFKKRAFKWMGASIVIVSILSFSLSKIDIVDYEALNQKIINNRLEVKNNLRLSSSKMYRTATFRYAHLPNISVAMPKESFRKNPLLFVGQAKISKGELPYEMLQLKTKQSEEIRNYMPTFLRIDKEVPMSYVHELKRELAFVDLIFLNYLIIPSDADYNERYYLSANRRTYLEHVFIDHFAPGFNLYAKKRSSVLNKVDISISKNDYLVNEVKIPLNELASVIQKQLVQDLDYAIVLDFKEDINFGVYIGIVSSIYEAIQVLRNQEALKLYGMDYKALEEQFQMRDELNSIIDKYPTKTIELWQDSRIKLPRKTRPDFALPEIK